MKGMKLVLGHIIGLMTSLSCICKPFRQFAGRVEEFVLADEHCCSLGPRKGIDHPHHGEFSILNVPTVAAFHPDCLESC